MIRPQALFELSLQSAANLVGIETVPKENVVITGATSQDTDVNAGDIFLAFPGSKVHGASFIQSAISRGAVAVLTDEAGSHYGADVPVLVVPNARISGAIIAASLYKSPSRDLESIGITGTNGKTTVSTLLYQLFQSAGRETGLIGTVQTRIGREVVASVRTTPEASELQGLLATMRERHVREMVMEVSSHAMAMSRVKGTHFKIVGFTNLTQDHLDFHGNMHEYFQAKASLFSYEYSDLGIINIDSTYGQKLIEISEIPTISISRINPKAQWRYSAIHPTNSGYDICIRGSGGILIDTRTILHGGFNLDNLLMAVAIASECGIDPIEIASAIPELIGASGRLEAVRLGQNFKAFVDYAHTPDAVKNALAAVREITEGRVIAVLGCGGDRDSGKRPLMGEQLLAGSDIAIFTSDNPRTENPIEILRQMVANCVINSPSMVIADRGQAITYAVNQAEAGDTVIILGKGHEVGQEVNGVTEPFDDFLVLAQSVESKP